VEKYGTVGQATDDYIIRCMHFACLIAKFADTHSEYLILIAFPRQQWLCECTSMLRYTYITCLAIYYLEEFHASKVKGEFFVMNVIS
jgi:hypothetical protein